MATKFTATASAAKAVIRNAGKTKAKPEAVKPEVAEEVVGPKSPLEQLHERVHGAYNEFFAATGEVGPKQRIAAWVAGAIVAFGVGYLGGWVSAVLMATVVIATSSMFLGVLVYVLGVLLSIWIGASAGAYAHQFVLSVNRRAYDSVKNRVSSWFKREPKLAEA